MSDAIWAGGDQLDRLCAAKALAAVLINAHLDALTRQNVVYKNDSPLVTGNKDATVGNLFDVDLKAAADP